LPALNKEVGWQSTPTTISTCASRQPRQAILSMQPRQAILSMLPRPALHDAQGDPVLLSDPSQWHTLLEVGP
jgi:hypothetical protein